MNTPLPVEVSDTVPVEIAPIEPVFVRVNGTIPGTAVSGAAFPLYTVPSGMRLVVEHASAEATMGLGSTAGFRLTDSGGQTWHVLVAAHQGEFNGSDIYAASQDVRFVAGPGEVVQLLVYRSSSAVGTETNTVAGCLSGYLVPE
ncbi:MAG: hypothetical protein ACOZNI_07610 [Myxococcota bacterium]